MRKLRSVTLAAGTLALAASCVHASTFDILNSFQGGSGGYANPQPGPFFSPVTPPDVTGAVGMNGTTELVTEFLNGYYGVYTSGGVPIAQETNGVFWENALGAATFDQTFGVGGSVFPSDPRMVYDPSSKRWFVSQITASSIAGVSGNSFLLAVSNTSNPAGTWSGFALPTAPGFGAGTDFDMLGMNNSNVYISGDAFSAGAGGYSVVGSTTLAIPKASLIGAGGATPSVNGYQLFDASQFAAGTVLNHPVMELGSSSNTEYLYSGDNTNQLVRSSISGTSQANYTLSQGAGSVASFTGSALAANLPLTAQTSTNSPNNAGQPGTAATLSTGDSRLSSNLYMVNGLVWGTQTVVNPHNSALSAIRYYAIDPALNRVVAQGIITDPNHATSSLYYGSIAVSSTGNVVIDFEESSTTQSASTFIVTGAYNGSSLALAASGIPQLLSAGTGYYVESPGQTTGSSRWGDYSTIWADPNNPHNFWIMQELPSSTNPNQWTTMITQIDPPGPTTIGPASTVPEPGVLPILLLGVAPLLLTLRRRKVGG